MIIPLVFVGEEVFRASVHNSFVTSVVDILTKQHQLQFSSVLAILLPSVFECVLFYFLFSRLHCASCLQGLWLIKASLRELWQKLMLPVFSCCGIKNNLCASNYCLRTAFKIRDVYCHIHHKTQTVHLSKEILTLQVPFRQLNIQLTISIDNNKWSKTSAMYTRVGCI